MNMFSRIVDKVMLSVVIRAIRRFQRKAQYTNIPRIRRSFEKITARWYKPHSACSYTPQIVAGVPCEWVKPRGCAANCVLVYFHGGGYNVGGINTHRGIVSQLAVAAGVQVLSVDYRLAPEHKFPAPLEDVEKVYTWLLENNFAARHVAFGGDSAGGGLAIASLLYLRDKKITLPACAIGLSPWLDLSLSGESFATKQFEDPMLVAKAFPLWVKNYMGDADPREPYASPVFAQLENLCPIYIQVGTAELLLDDARRFVARAQAAGVKVQLDIFKDYFHVFQSFYLALPKARAANKLLGRFVREHIA